MKVVIVGGVAGGATAAARIRRLDEQAEIVVFERSGFISYVYNQCGWNFGRLSAQGIYNICTRTNNPQPGDLVFFKGTYDTPGISHVGIYVGDGWMLHCGDPISYTNLNSAYWQSYFYAYGRLS